MNVDCVAQSVVEESYTRCQKSTVSQTEIPGL